MWAGAARAQASLPERSEECAEEWAGVWIKGFFALRALWEPEGLISVAAVGKAIRPGLLSGILEKAFPLWGRKTRLEASFQLLRGFVSYDVCTRSTSASAEAGSKLVFKYSTFTCVCDAVAVYSR